MKVDEPSVAGATYRFHELDGGDVFEYDGGWFVKMRETVELRKEVVRGVRVLNAVWLKDGDPCRIRPMCKVVWYPEARVVMGGGA